METSPAVDAAEKLKAVPKAGAEAPKVVGDEPNEKVEVPACIKLPYMRVYAGARH
jgi:hypothetical protein